MWKSDIGRRGQRRYYENGRGERLISVEDRLAGMAKGEIEAVVTAGGRKTEKIVEEAPKHNKVKKYTATPTTNTPQL